MRAERELRAEAEQRAAAAAALTAQMRAAAAAQAATPHPAIRSVFIANEELGGLAAYCNR